MKINPKTLRWTPPAEDTAGKPIDYDLDYEIGFDNDLDGVFEPYLVVVGDLQTDGTYTAPISDMALTDGDKRLAMRAIRRDAQSLKSVWSTAVDFEIELDVPTAPFGLVVE